MKLLNKPLGTHIKNGSENVEGWQVWMSYAAFEAAPLPLPEEEGEDGAGGNAAAERAGTAESGPESAAEREARARRCALPSMLFPVSIPYCARDVVAWGSSLDDDASCALSGASFHLCSGCVRMNQCYGCLCACPAVGSHHGRHPHQHASVTCICG